MVNSQLVSYIKKQLAQGYNINSIKLNLARSGYSPEQIEAAAGITRGSSKHLTKILLLVGGGAVVLAVLITVLILLFSGTDEIGPQTGILVKDVGLEVLLKKSVIELDGNLEFEVKLVNLGSGSNFQVEIKNEIYFGTELVEGKEDTLILRTQARQNYKMGTNLDVGSYQLKTMIFYGKEKNEKITSFSVNEIGEVKDEVIIMGLGTLTGESVRKIEDIKNIAESDFGKAKSLCLGLDSVLERDTCLLETGLKVNKEIFCEDITDNDKKDSCYVNIALALKNYNLCDYVINQNLKDACLALG